MAFVSGTGGGGGGLPPQAPAAGQLNSQQLLETLILQQQQQAAVSNQNNLVGLLAQALLGGQSNQLASALGAANMATAQQPQQPPQNALFQQLQQQLALSTLLGQNSTSLTNPLLGNPTMNLYYQLLQQQQQQTSLLQQLQQTQQQPVQAQSAAPVTVPVHTAPIQISQVPSAFQPPPQPAPSSGNVEVQLNAQEKLMALLNADQQAKNELEQRIMSANTSASTSQIQPDRVPRNTKEVQDRIDKLISENAEILQPQEPLLKRRPYHRAVGQQSSMDDSNSSSTRTSPGIQARDPRMLAASSRTQSLYEPINGIRAFGGGSLTSGQPVVRQQPQHNTPTCPYCQVPFPNEAGLQCHELRCSKRIEIEKAKETTIQAKPVEANNRHPLKRRLLEAAVADEPPVSNQAKLARKDSGDVIVVAEKVVEVKREFIEAFGHPSLPRRATIGAIPTNLQAQAPPPPQQQPLIIQPGPLHAQVPPQMISPTPAPTAFHQINQSRLNIMHTANVVRQLHINQTREAKLPPPSLPPPKEEFSVNRLFPLDGNANKPYTLVLPDDFKNRDPPENKPRRRNITSETFVCLHRAQPMFVEQKGNLSMYSNWHQVTVNESDAKLNLAFMAQCSAKPKMGHHSFWKYTNANRDMVQFKVTHSSFWEFSEKRVQLRREQLGEQLSPPLQMLFDPTKAGAAFWRMEVEEPEEGEVDRIEIPLSNSDMKEEVEVKLEIDEDERDEFDWQPSISPRPSKKTEPIIGGHRTDELYVYVRGRGRGRYVCDRCGIRCKKPSMLKKHIKSHTDIRPFKCRLCNFSFKTKGNLTKHLSSKTHKRRLQQGDAYESDNEDRLEIVDENDGEDDKEDTSLVEVPDRLDDEESDEEDLGQLDMPFRRFGQEEILLERDAHTPPSRWVLEREDGKARSWPEGIVERRCMSAPPVAVAGPLFSEKTKKSVVTLSTPPLPITAMQFISMDTSPTTIIAPITQNGLSSTRINGTLPSQPYIMNFFPKEENLKCDQCDKTFRKAADLSYHQLTHNVEKQQMSSKNRMFQCPECRIPARTKAMLSKHMEQAHGCHIDESAMAAIDPSASTQSVLGGNPNQVVNNPRSFMCLDCNIGFRKHGILAKHLRSKTHVTKLETLKRLPEDSLSLIQGHDQGACLNEVDTTDCEKARASLVSIVESIRTKKAIAMQVATATSNGSINLECREQLAPSPMPGPTTNGFLRSSYSETSSPFRSRCGSAASTSADIPRKRSDSLVNRLDNNTIQAMKFISANVWVPPKVHDPVGSLNKRKSSQFQSRPENVAIREMEEHPSASPIMRILSANGNKSPPIPPGTKCSVCGTNFDTPVDLQVHLYTDHISVKDGTFFRCPKKLCEKVYPNKESLRVHVVAHYRSDGDLREEDGTSIGACPSIRAEELEASTPMTDGSDSSCHSPTVDASRLPTISESPAMPCMTCGKAFTDITSLQQHWLTHVANRSHVCPTCDAGFTTQEQLLLHQASHHNTNGVS